MPEGVDPRDEQFDPRRGPIYVRGENGRAEAQGAQLAADPGRQPAPGLHGPAADGARQYRRSPHRAPRVLALPGKPPGRLAGQHIRRTARPGPPGRPHLAEAFPGRPGRRDVPLPAVPPPGLGVAPGRLHHHGLHWRPGRVRGAGTRPGRRPLPASLPLAQPGPAQRERTYRPADQHGGGGHPAALHPRRDQRPVLLHHLRAGRRRRRAAVRGAPEHAAHHGELRAAGGPGRAAHRLGGPGRDLRSAPLPRPVPVPGPGRHGGRRGARPLRAAGQRAHRPASRSFRRHGRLLPALQEPHRRRVASRRGVLPARSREHAPAEPAGTGLPDPGAGRCPPVAVPDPA